MRSFKSDCKEDCKYMRVLEQIKVKAEEICVRIYQKSGVLSRTPARVRDPRLPRRMLLLIALMGPCSETIPPTLGRSSKFHVALPYLGKDRRNTGTHEPNVRRISAFG